MHPVGGGPCRGRRGRGYLFPMEIVVFLILAGGALAMVAYPFLRAGVETRGAGAGALPPLDEAALAAEVERYRAALRAGTACRRCCFANPPGSRYCAECGRRLDATGPEARGTGSSELEIGTGVQVGEDRGPRQPAAARQSVTHGYEAREDGRGTASTGSHA